VENATFNPCFCTRAHIGAREEIMIHKEVEPDKVEPEEVEDEGFEKGFDRERRMAMPVAS
jgi:hypothetical protein